MNLQLRQLARGFVVVIAFALITAGLTRQNYGAVGMGVVIILAVLLDLKKRQLAQGFLVIIALALITAGLAAHRYGAAVVGAVVILAVLIDRSKHKQSRVSDVDHKGRLTA
jgi:predicted ABC-type sugar transport system permease subunit